MSGSPLSRESTILPKLAAAANLADAQALVVNILNDMLTAPIGGVDATIDSVLSRMGQYCGSDRTYVFRTQDRKTLVNSHEWVASGILPMIDTLQNVPLSMIDHLRPRMDAGAEIIIPDVAALPDNSPEKGMLMEQGIRSLLLMPMLHEGALVGFVGFDAVHQLHSFQPEEVILLRSVANAINTLLLRAANEQELHAANAALSRERNRLQATLSAMPDLVIELDADGRFVDYFSGGTDVAPSLAEALQGQLMDDVLPRDLAQEGRRIFAEVDQSGKTSGHVFSYDLGGGMRWFQANCAARAPDVPGTSGGYLLILRDVTHEREQGQMIERLSEVARRTTNFVVVTDAQRRIEWVNQAFETRTGYSLDEVRGRNPSHFLQGDLTDPSETERIRAALDNGQPVQAEVLNHSRSGEAYWVNLNIQPTFDAKGVLRGFMAVQTDITQRKQQETDLAAAAQDAITARQRLFGAVEALQDGFALFDADDRLVLCNDRYRALYPGLAQILVPGIRFEEILRFGLKHGEYQEAVGREETWLARRMDLHRKEQSEMEHQLSDGRWIRVFEKATPDGGRVGMRVDITSLKAAEARAISERAAAMDASRDGISLTDASGRLLYVNAAFLAMFGIYLTKDIIGHHWSRLYPDEGVAFIERVVMPALRTKGNWQGEVLGQRLDEGVVDQESSMTLQADGSILTITRDISERRRADMERARLRDDLQLAQRREVIGQLAAGLAHDFNNLLAAIAGSATLIQLDQNDTSPVNDHAGRILSSADQAAALVRRLLTLGAPPKNHIRFDLAGQIRAAAELLRTALGDDVEFEVSLPDSVIMASADPTDILQLVLNLGLNARDAIKASGADGKITLTLSLAQNAQLKGPFRIGGVQPGTDYACITVKDTGRGMDATTAAEVFRPYFSTKGTDGTGLGLAIVAGVVSGNDGALALTTDAHRGSTFRVLWPLHQELPSQVAPRSQAKLTGRLDGKMVLVVDDAPDVLEVLTAFLEQAGAEVAPCSDPRDAVAAIRGDPKVWDVVLTDFDMAAMSGAALAEVAHKYAPDLPVVLLTALPDWQRRSDGKANSFRQVLAKPITRDELVAAIEAAIRKPQRKGA